MNMCFPLVFYLLLYYSWSCHFFQREQVILRHRPLPFGPSARAANEAVGLLTVSAAVQIAGDDAAVECRLQGTRMVSFPETCYN